jgi:CRISPR/Cas system-associated exonuclease Cas4 (RecB family)
VAIHRHTSTIDAIRVDDFKYSSASNGIARQLKTSFQIPVYAYLATRALETDASIQIEGRYLLLRSPGNPVVSQPLDTALFDEVRQRIEGLVEKVSEGRLEPSPSDRQSCTECDYRRLCRLYGG